MKTYNQIRETFYADYEAAIKHVASDGWRTGKLFLDEVAYDVGWGVEVDRADLVVEPAISVLETDPTSRSLHPELRDQYLTIDKCVMRGYKRLEAWRKGAGSFPETVEELFAELP